MNAVVFDTLILSRRLAASGVPVDQAQGMAAAIAETIGEQIVTRRDMGDLQRDFADNARDQRTHSDGIKTELTARIDQVDAKLTARIDQVKTELTTRIDQVEAKLSTRIDQVKAELTARIDQVEAKLSARIDQVEAKLSARIDLLSAEIRQSEQRQTIRLGLMLTGAVAVMAGLAKIL